MREQIVITGSGIISAIGEDKLSTLRSLIDSKSGIGSIRHLDTPLSHLPVGEVKKSNDELKRQLCISKNTTISRTSLLGIWAVKEALEEADIDIETYKNKQANIALISGTTVGGIDLTEGYFRKIVEGENSMLHTIKQMDCGSSTKAIADYFGIFSQETTISTACSSALNSIILGYRMLLQGQADIIVAGGAEALSKFHLSGFESLKILSEETCRPFDLNRKGLNLGEGASFIVMEREKDAKERAADIKAYISGWGNSCDAFHQTASSSDGKGAILSMKQAIEMAGIEPADIDYINAHGTGTDNNDQSESTAIKTVFGDTYPEVSSTKGFTGHATSAAGSIELTISMLAMQNRFIPKNLGWATPMNNGLIPTHTKKETTIHHFLCNSFGFGGNDSSIIISDRPTNYSERATKERQIKVLSKVEILSAEQLAELKNFVKPMETRRMCNILKSSLLASLKAIDKAGIDNVNAIITATNLGCWENSEKILLSISEAEATVSPTLFMQSTHNTIGSNIAIHLGCHGYNQTYAHGKESLRWAIKDAEMLLHQGLARTVLVGYHEESTLTLNSLRHRLGDKQEPEIVSMAMILGIED